MDNLTGISSKDILLNYGPTKLLIDTYHWHSPNTGIIAAYSPQAHDVEGHFGVFRGVDQVESFAQAVGSCSVFLECQKLGCSPAELREKFVPLFISIGQVYFHSHLEVGDTYINAAVIKFFKFRQIVADGKIYKVPRGLDLNDYFSCFTEKQLTDYDLGNEFTLVAELFDITARAIKKDIITKYTA